MSNSRQGEVLRQQYHRQIAMYDALLWNTLANLNESTYFQSVRELLNKCNEAAEVLASYGSSGKAFLRSKLNKSKKSRILFVHFRKKGNCICFRITTARFLYVMKEICEIFPFAVLEIYFVPYERNVDEKPKAVWGKLFSAYQSIEKIWTFWTWYLQQQQTRSTRKSCTGRWYNANNRIMQNEYF